MTELTSDLLAQIMQCSSDRAQECFPAMVSAMRTFHINTAPRITCFLSVVKWESTGLVDFSERAAGDGSDGYANYNGRADLGNTHPGDGPRYKGSGPIQVTGYDNFVAAQQALNSAGISINIVQNPALARTVQYGFWISCWWWDAHGCNQLAEKYGAMACQKEVNTGSWKSADIRVQGLSGRLAANQFVAQFGALSLPGSVPAPPVPAPEVPNLLEEIMALDRTSDDYKAFVADIAHAVLTTPAVEVDNVAVPINIANALSQVANETTANWTRLSDLAKAAGRR